MKLQLEPEEARELLMAVTGRLIDEARFSDRDRAALRTWRSEKMRTGSPGMRELTEKINAEIERTFKTRQKSAIRKPDWK
jgi:hypothetical protein